MTLDQFLDKWKAVPVRARGLALMATLTVLLVAMAGAEHLKRINGQEIILSAHPVDPRDILRGAFVALDYDIENIDSSMIDEMDMFATAQQGDTAWLVLRKDGDAWALKRVLEQRPAAAPGEVIVQSKWRSIYPPDPAAPQKKREGSFTVDIGADHYYADEASAKTLEKAIRDGQFQVVLSVGANGKPVIKGLVLDGVRRDETFF